MGPLKYMHTYVSQHVGLYSDVKSKIRFIRLFFLIPCSDGEPSQKDMWHNMGPLNVEKYIKEKLAWLLTCFEAAWMFRVQKQWNRLSITRRRQRPLLGFLGEVYELQRARMSEAGVLTTLWQPCAATSFLLLLWHIYTVTEMRSTSMRRNINGTRGSNVFEMAGKTKRDARPNYPQFLADNTWKSNPLLKPLKADQFGHADHFNSNNFYFSSFVYFCILYFRIFSRSPSESKKEMKQPMRS